MAVAATIAGPPPLPELRQDLQLHPGPVGTGEQTWLVYDPVRHRYFQVSRAAFELLERWAAVPALELAGRASAELDREVAEADVNELARFVTTNHLTLQPANDDAVRLAAQELVGRRSWLMHIVHSYLFFRIPVARPERFLKATLPLVAPFYSRSAATIVLLAWLAGLYFVSRQWDRFAATFLDLASLEGALGYAASLVVVKSLHELGHAYTATRAGVRVNTMGVAFMVLTPILYTDVTDAWRLRHHRQKLAIDAAGIVVELALAGFALLAWVFLPDGPMRTAAFLTATTGLFAGLLINLNPLMRFDGYYMLVDAWHMPNLQSRSNEMARWWLRERLFGLGHAPPERLPQGKRRLVIAYALAVWVYRLLLFLGIALVVYHLFFKALGVLLFAVEIIWFICLPILGELRQWWKMRNEIVHSRRGVASAVAATAAVVALFWPWGGSVTVQGVALADLETRLYAPRAARVERVSVADQAPIAAGEALIVLRAPDLDHEAGQTRKRIDLVRLRLDRIAGDEADRSQRGVLERELARHLTDLAGLQAEQRRLVVRAPHDGVARDVDPDLQAGEWIDEAALIGRIVRSSPALTHGYLEEEDVWRVEIGAEAKFVPEDPLMGSRRGRVVELAGTGTRSIEHVYLASVYGGKVASDRSPENELRPRSGRHLVQVRLDGDPVGRAVRGTLHLAAKPESIASAVWRRILQVLVRESSA